MRLTVSLGLSVRVPSLRNETVADARKELAAANLLVDIRKQRSRDVGAGRVIGTEPAPGSEVDCNSTVTLIVSKGQNLITLDNVIGASEESARAELERRGLIVNVETKDDDAPRAP